MINILKGYTPDYDNDEHSPWSPSGGGAWLACPLWPLANWQQESISSAAASEGTRLHKVAAEVLMGTTRVAAVSSEDWDKVGQYIEYCSKLPGKHQVEAKINLESLGFPCIFGSADFISLDDENKVIEIVDFKSGHYKIDPNTPQGKFYLLGAIGEKILEYELKFTIFQDNKPSTAYFSPFELLGWLYTEVKPAYMLTLENNPQPVAGEKQCQWCHKKGDCPANRDLAIQAAKDIFAEVPTLGPEQLADILNKTSMIKSFLDAAATRAKELAETGTEIPGYKLVEGRRSKAWHDEEGLHKYLNKKLKKADRYTEPQLKSPAQMKKSVAKAYREELDRFIEIKPGKLTLKPVQDERQIITSAALAFKEV